MDAIISWQLQELCTAFVTTGNETLAAGQPGCWLGNLQRDAPLLAIYVKKSHIQWFLISKMQPIIIM
ncbi:hypothetical protein [Chromobacterium amazonense]|uniref:hypothetical protein n=1 Tax=Chromobacterium amazonense TaxID=1382803 RepID=UPI003F791AAC